MTYVILALLGLAWGSFVNALVWRFYEQEELKGDETDQPRHPELVSGSMPVDRGRIIRGAWMPKRVRHDNREDLSIIHGRSMCPHCRHQLAAKDLIPVFSWLFLRGKCRYCGKPIGWQYPAVELLTAALFIISYIWWPMSFHGAGLLEFVLWLVFLIGFMALAVYDLKWFLLPNRIVYPLIVLAVLQILAVVIFYHGGHSLLLGSLWGLLIDGGLFYVLFQISGGKWIGGGDVKLGALLGLIVGGPLMSILVLFIASVCGTLVSLPLMASGKVKRDTEVPFGPFLLLATVIIRIFGAGIASWLRHKGFIPPA